MSSTSIKKSDVRDMTSGNIAEHIFMFALPLIAGNLVQQLYNLVDTWVVGNFVSDEAFAAVGAISAPIKLSILLFSGFSSGMGIVISQLFGAGEHEKVKKAAHSSALLSIILSVLITVGAVLSIPLFIKLTGIPDNLIPDAKEYLTILFSYLAFPAIYNAGAAVLRAVGNSKKPFYFLVATAVANVFLDLLFVINFKMGVAGAAYATVISQAVAAVLVVIELLRTNSDVKIIPKKISFDKEIVSKMIALGFPIALQSTLVQFSNVLIMSYISHFGQDFIGAYTVYVKIDQTLFMTAQSLSVATATYVGQNVGASLPERAKKGPKISCLIELSIWAFLTWLLELFAPQIVGFFNKAPMVISYGAQFLRRVTPMFPFMIVGHICAGAFQGVGNTKIATYMSLIFNVLGRQLYLYLATHFIANTEFVVMMCFPVGWLLYGLVMYICSRSIDYNTRIELH